MQSGSGTRSLLHGKPTLEHFAPVSLAARPANNTMICETISGRTEFRTAATWLVLLLLTQSVAGAPPLSGDEALVRGAIQDAAGSPAAGAQVTARNLASDETRSTVSGADGRFEIGQLPPGAYQLEIAASGDGASVSQRIELASGETRTITFVLETGSQRVGSGPPEEEFPGMRREEEAAARPVSSASGNLIEESQLVGLPLNGRSYSQLATLQSDVTDTESGSASRGTGGGSLTMAGGRSLSNNFLLDGTSIMNADNRAPRSAAGVQLGSDAVFEVRVFSTYYGAEYGRSSGGVLNSITRSGTPQIHGTLFEYFRNSKLDARNFFDKEAEPPPFKRNQFGFTITGPVVQDRTFFMASFEAMRDRLSQTAVNYFPDAGARSGDLGNGRIVPVRPSVRPYLDLYPIPNDIRLGRGIGRNLAPQFQPTNESFLTVRVDHKLTDRDSFFARYTFDDASSRVPDEMYLFEREIHSRQQYFTLIGSHTFSPRTLTSVRLGYSRPGMSERDDSNVAIPRELYFVPGSSQFGRIQVPGLSDFGPGGGLPQGSLVNSFQFAEDVFLQRGLHAVKLGFEVHRYRTDVFNSWGQHGFWDFNSLESFLQAGPAGTSLWVSLPGSESDHGYRQTLAGFYVQDEYRVRPNLELSLGLRYEFATKIRDTQNRIAFIPDRLRDSEVQIGEFTRNNPGLRNFGPRVSISWSPGASGETNISAGFGVYYDQVLGYAAVPLKNSAPYYQVVNQFNFDSSAVFPDAVGAAAGGQPQIQVMDYDGTRTPMLLRYNFSIRQEAPGDWQLQASYAGARGNHLFRRYESNRFPIPVTEPDGSLFFPSEQERSAVNPAFGSVNLLSTDAQSFYNALQLSASRNVGRGISLRAGYTYSKSVDDSSTLDWGNLQYALDRKLDRGLSDFDLRHRLAFNYFYTLPFGNQPGGGVSGALAKVLGGWRLGGIASLRSGTPFSAEINVRYPNYLFAARRPDLLPGHDNNPTQGTSEGCGRVTSGRELGGPELYYDPCSFAAPPPGRLGNLGRNTMIAPSVFSMDFSLQREFLLDATKRLQFRAEVFNLPNRSNFDVPSGGGITVFSGESAERASTAGRINSTSTTSRQIQFALRFSF